ncbi:alkene reductase [Acetobacter orleanensis]|uniref:Alkene reductase n=1 Tax=Acetobacter orleanensis TaxID=104099 RepID=A0A4Y3TSJ9_9PROT|nr:alkene reductase [Acetobacter orleanensis]KXV66972.1 N-ethylmaleimide reductase [Acetobacter orleanensis]PCD78340.1 alkene reductase [Acetobacter orleanensis]GAN67542.1 NADH:flavin oxidoreductase [Acetobacter orleanensis JCM 7639]GBR28929.1 NADH:flavin oxidoreductase [Acetobacter orleanensis NRIC 0473]GEB84067.1 alkene reductase [Acetobacter orleanensis]
MVTLFDPIQLGDIHAANRVIMAPLTRARATRDHIPTPIMAEYYAQRSSAGLIISEAVGISQEGLGWPYAPGIWSQQQVEAWKPVVEAVHKKNGKIVAQLWHMGRMVHSSVTGLQPVSCSPTTPSEKLHTYDGKQDAEQARELTKQDIERILEEYERATRNALAAGFDGVQIHAANGYLIDEFLRDSTNLRTDSYGGSAENRIRFLQDVAERVVAIAGAGKTSVRLSPNGESQGCIDSHPEHVFVPAACMLNTLEIAFLELRESSPDGTFFGQTNQAKLHGPIKNVFHHPLILNQDYTREDALAAVETGIADAISFGRNFIANPDLVYRLENDLPLNQDIVKTWYSQGQAGYTDYSALNKEG